MRYEFEGDKGLFAGLYSFVFLIGIALICGGIAFFFNTREFLKKAIHTKAHLVEIVKVDVQDIGSMAVFEFRTEDGRPIQFKMNLDELNKTTNSEVEVIYDADDARDHSLLSDNFYMSAVVCFAFSVPFLVVSIGYFFFLRFLNRL
jgi:hypothetical protein